MYTSRLKFHGKRHSEKNWSFPTYEILQFQFTNKHEIWNHYESTQHRNESHSNNDERLNSHFESLQPWKLLSTTSSGKNISLFSNPFNFFAWPFRFRRGRRNLINHKARSTLKSFEWLDNSIRAAMNRLKWPKHEQTSTKNRSMSFDDEFSCSLQVNENILFRIFLNVNFLYDTFPVTCRCSLIFILRQIFA